MKAFKSTLALVALVQVSLLFPITRAYADAVPHFAVTNNATLPTNAIPRSAPIPPPSPSGPSLLSSPPPTTSFQGLGDDTTRWPPDTDGCVGPNHVVTMLNTQVRIQNRAGTTNFSTVSLQAWWAARLSGSSAPFDPRLLYDPYGQRWIAVAVDYAQSGNSAILIAVSQTSDPTGSWTAQGVDVDASNQVWADFPTVGFNQDKVVVTFNLLNISNNGNNGVGVFVFNKTNLYAGPVTPQGLYQPYQSGATVNGLGVTPAVAYSTNTTTMYLLQDFQDNASGSSYLALYTLTGNAGSAVLTRSSNYPSASAWASTPAGGDAVNLGPQLGSSVKIHTGDSRLSQVVYRNGSLWCAHTIYLPANAPTRSAVQWWQISTNGTVVQNGRIDDPAGVDSYAYPSIAVNRFGDALIGYSRFSTNQYASANYALHGAGDPNGTVESDYLFKAGVSPYWKTDSYGRNRWGDYSMTWVDPVNDADFWTIQEYAETNVGPATVNLSGRWGVQWANVQVPIPANDNFANATTISGAQGTVSATNLRASKEAGEPNHAGFAGGASIWFNWTAPASGSVTLDTIGSGFDTVLAVYTGTGVGSLTAIAADNDSGGFGASKVVFTATAATSYRIAVDGVNAAQGGVTLDWIQPAAPVFTTQPQSQAVLAGNTVAFTSVAIGTPPPAYQWRFNGVNIGGATSANYTKTGTAPGDAGSYTVVASSSAGATTSATAVLTVYNSAAATLGSSGYAGQQFQFSITGVPGYSYIVQASTNLTTWTPVKTNSSPFSFTDTSATNYPYRFYRAIH